MYAGERHERHARMRAARGQANPLVFSPPRVVNRPFKNTHKNPAWIIKMRVCDQSEPSETSQKLNWVSG